MTGSYEEDENAFRSAFLDCEDECNIFVDASKVRGFFDGAVDAYGYLLPDQYQDNTITPRLINSGIDIFPGELGDYLGNTDIGQVRYFNKPLDMRTLLEIDTVYNQTSFFPHYNISRKHSNYHACLRNQ